MDDMNNPGFRPNKGRYLILPAEVKGQETKIEGSEYTIDTPRDIHEKPSEGTVVARGNECTEFAVGDRVLYGKYSGYEQLFDGKNYLILAETEILGERLITPFDDAKCLSCGIVVPKGRNCCAKCNPQNYLSHTEL
jgi:chaperonin GroES